MTSLEEKAAGAVAWGLGDYPLAIEKFTAALDAEKAGANDKTLTLTLYSNRSAAYMKVQNKSAALLDADKCISLDSNWPKGFIRKGDALFSMVRQSSSSSSSQVAPLNPSNCLFPTVIACTCMCILLRRPSTRKRTMLTTQPCASTPPTLE